MFLFFLKFRKPIIFEFMMKHQISLYFTDKGSPIRHRQKVSYFQHFITTRFNYKIDIFHEKVNSLFHSIENQYFYLLKCWFSFFIGINNEKQHKKL